MIMKMIEITRTTPIIITISMIRNTIRLTKMMIMNNKLITISIRTKLKTSIEG